MVQSASVRTELHSWWNAQREHLKSLGLASEEWWNDAKDYLRDLTAAPAPTSSEIAPAPAAPAAPAEAREESIPSPASASKSAPASEPQAPAASADAEEGAYALVVGAFEEGGNAERLAANLRKAGYPAQVLQSKVGLKKVALRTFADANSARQAKAELKSDFPAIWIYHE
jgi:cell division septation protein DedD